MKNATKLLAFVLCIITVASCFVFTAGAADKNYGFTMNVAYDESAKTVTATVTALDEDIVGAAMAIGFDPDALTLLKNDGTEGEPTDYSDLYANYFDFNKEVVATNAGALEKVYDKTAASIFMAYIIKPGSELESFAKGDEIFSVMFKVKDETKLSSLASINKLVYFANAANDIYDDPYLLYNYMETIKKTENGEIVEEEIMRNGKAYFNHAPKVTLKYAYDGIDTDIKVGSFTVTVVDKGGKPLAGAAVKIDNQTKKTGSEGKASFDLPYGEYAITVTLDGYVVGKGEVKVGDSTKDTEVELDKITVPGTPNAPKVTSTGTNYITIKWTAPTDNGNSAITGYKISYGKTAAANTSVVETSAAVLTKKITSLTSNTKYYFRVAAVNAEGEGEYSDIVSGTTDSISGGSTGGNTGSGTSGSDTVYYTVTYKIGDGTYVGSLSETVQAGRTPTKAPSVTAPAGKVFKGWSTDGKTVKNLAAFNVTSNMTLYAVYEDRATPSTPTENAHKAYMTGYSDGTARPDKTITRKEAVTLIARICADFDENKAYTSSSFSDVAADAWYKKYVDYVVEKGYVKGYSDGTFGPDREITREEFATIIFRIAGYTADGSMTFSDVPATHWAKDNISTLAAKGIITGYSDGTFGLGKSIKRAEAVTMLNRYLGRVPNADLVNAAYNGAAVPASDISGHWAFAQMIEAMVEHDTAKFHG